MKMEAKSKIDVRFICYEYKFTEGVSTMFKFFPNGVWDEDKLVIEEALRNYPLDQYNWIHTEDEHDMAINFETGNYIMPAKSMPHFGIEPGHVLPLDVSDDEDLI